MIVFGAWLGMAGDKWTSGLWMAFIGWFLLNAAQRAFAQVAIRETLSGLPRADVMSHEVPTVPRNMSLEGIWTRGDPHRGGAVICVTRMIDS